MRRAFAIARHDTMIARRDPVVVIVLFVMPVVIMVFFRPIAGIALRNAGFHAVNGAEQVVPGMTLIFSFSIISMVGFNLFREHGWSTWDRIRTSTAQSWEILAGKLMLPFVLCVMEYLVLFVISYPLFGFHLRGSLVATGIVVGAASICIVAIGIAAAALCRTMAQVTTIGNICLVFLGGLGGALVPLEALPRWSQRIAPATPTYWAMRGFREVTLHEGSVRSVALPTLMLLTFAAAGIVIAVLKLRFSDSKIAWT